MRKKIHADPITRKNQKTYRAAQTVAKIVYPIAFAPLAANTKANPLQPLLKIGVDLMGNDNAPQVLLDALKELPLPPGVQLVGIGTPEFEKSASPFPYFVASEVIGMEEHPLLALRRKKNASVHVGMRLLKAGQIHAFVSAGNTGALVSSAKMVLSTLPGILRPCLVTLMPTKKNPVAVLDVGANVEVKATHLVQFALIGAAFQKTRGIKMPNVGLLNIGSEPLKGTSELRIAYHELQKNNAFRFAGNIEGKNVFDGDVDVLVTDGFTGNVFLKTAEGIVSLILDRIQLPSSELKAFQSLHYAEYPGALLAGIRGIVIKCHGYSTPKGFTNAVLGAIELAKEGFVQKLLNDLR
jgi:glycerol-3-phosphate acyltransferase PlsX